MAIFKCKMCGGNLELQEGVTVAECEYCGSTQTVPTADNEKKMTLFSRANRLRAGCEFDKAAGVYESIVSDFPEEAEAYWGLVLCKYGIEYVDDPATGKKIPTCHRSGFDSVLEDSDFEQACENADAYARRVYRDEAKQIEELRKGIISVSANEKPYDIFICYKETSESGERTLDSVLAQDIYDALTGRGYRVFFSRVTLEDKLGMEYEPYIFAALNSARIMLAVGTDYEYYNAVWVKNEWSRYLKLMAQDKGKHLIPCFKDIDAYDMPREFARLQAQDMGKVGAMQDLLRGIKKIVGKGETDAAPAAVASAANPTVDSLLKRVSMFLEDGDWKSADEYCEKVLDVDPENARAYLGKLLASTQTRTKDALKNCLLPLEEIDPSDYRKVLRFGDAALAAELTGYNEYIITRNQGARQRAEEARQQAEAERHRAEEARQREEAERRQRIQRQIETMRRERTGWSLAAGSDHAVGLKVDGTVIATGDNEDGQCDVSDWRNIMAVAVRVEYTVGLKSDGTVVATGDNKYGECDVSGWTDIVAVSAGFFHTVGLRSDGTVVAEGNNEDGQCDVSDWTDIVAVSAGYDHTVGLRSDGTVVAAGYNKYGQCNVSGWTDIVAVSAGEDHTVGLRSDGTVVAEGDNEDGQCDVSDWTDIVAIAAESARTVGLRSDGTVVATGNNSFGKCEVSDWMDIVAIAAGEDCTLGLKADGTVVTTGGRTGNFGTGLSRRGIAIPEGFAAKNQAQRQAKTAELQQAAERERQLREEQKRQEQQRREEQIAKLRQEQTELQAELANLRGLFTGKHRREIEARLAEIEKELKRL